MPQVPVSSAIRTSSPSPVGDVDGYDEKALVADAQTLQKAILSKISTLNAGLREPEMQIPFISQSLSEIKEQVQRLGALAVLKPSLAVVTGEPPIDPPRNSPVPIATRADIFELQTALCYLTTALSLAEGRLEKAGTAAQEDRMQLFRLGCEASQLSSSIGVPPGSYSPNGKRLSAAAKEVLDALPSAVAIPAEARAAARSRAAADGSPRGAPLDVARPSSSVLLVEALKDYKSVADAAEAVATRKAAEAAEAAADAAAARKELAGVSRSLRESQARAEFLEKQLAHLQEQDEALRSVGMIVSVPDDVGTAKMFTDSLDETLNTTVRTTINDVSGGSAERRNVINWRQECDKNTDDDVASDVEPRTDGCEYCGSSGAAIAGDTPDPFAVPDNGQVSEYAKSAARALKRVSELEEQLAAITAELEDAQDNGLQHCLRADEAEASRHADAARYQELIEKYAVLKIEAQRISNSIILQENVDVHASTLLRAIDKVQRRASESAAPHSPNSGLRSDSYLSAQMFPEIGPEVDVSSEKQSVTDKCPSVEHASNKKSAQRQTARNPRRRSTHGATVIQPISPTRPHTAEPSRRSRSPASPVKIPNAVHAPVNTASLFALEALHSSAAVKADAAVLPRKLSNQRPATARSVSTRTLNQATQVSASGLPNALPGPRRRPATAATARSPVTTQRSTEIRPRPLTAQGSPVDRRGSQLPHVSYNDSTLNLPARGFSSRILNLRPSQGAPSERPNSASSAGQRVGTYYQMIENGSSVKRGPAAAHGINLIAPCDAWTLLKPNHYKNSPLDRTPARAPTLAMSQYTTRVAQLPEVAAAAAAKDAPHIVRMLA